MHHERIEWSKDILEMLDILEPGLSLGRGRTKYFTRNYYFVLQPKKFNLRDDLVRETFINGPIGKPGL
jgi:hypothetical protein